MIGAFLEFNKDISSSKLKWKRENTILKTMQNEITI